MRALVTGGAGFVGANISLHLKKLGMDVLVMDNLARRGSEFNLPLFKEKGIAFYHGDVRNKEDFNLLPKPDVILECSAQPSAIDGYANPIFDITNNFVGLLNVLEFARGNGAAVILWSTNKVYCGSKLNSIPYTENETRAVWKKDEKFSLPGFSFEHGISEDFSIDGSDHSIYGLSKACADLICQEWHDAFQVKTVINRFSCLAGEGQFGKSAQGWVAWWAVASEFGLPLKYIGWNGKQVRDVLFIEDICRLIELEIKNLDTVAGQVFTVGGGTDVTLSLIEATELMQKKFKKKIPVSIEQTPRKADQIIYISDYRKATRMLGWKPKIGIEEGYERIIDWVRANKEKLSLLYC
ncbi:MAG: GDP-mannose 4,6-dehydratase [Elusimicrobia bacterium]|nr:GDP-mannose 4,6-dehydratase [Elusimicrobiota bacterium]MBI4218106.1 GDP-mannose 4,6-dehydratase [Elusimicrobiota bacterium]